MADQSQWVELRSEGLSAQIDPMGAQLSVLRDQTGRDLLWDGDPSVWAGRAPLLFPVVGALAGGHYRLGTETYPLSRHGFARGSKFEVTEATDHRATFLLRANEQTRRVYPFSFELSVSFELATAVLSVTTRVANVGGQNLLASVGYHPAFRWPLPYGHDRSEHFLEFERAEAPFVRRLDAKGLLTAERHATPLAGRRCSLTDSLFTNDALIFDEVRSRSVSYGAAAGPRIEVNLFDAPYLGIWSKPGASFICIEPWHGIADPSGYAGDFRDKPGVFEVTGGAERSVRMSIVVRD
jgi:galactose mutarotase-like enzyme